MKKEKIRCPRCTKMVARATDWAPGYPTLYKHMDPTTKRPCEVGYLRESKVDGHWTES